MSTSTIKRQALSTTSFARRSESLDLDFELDPGNAWRTVAGTETGRKLARLLVSEGVTLILTGAVLAAPSRPPVAALTPFIQTHVGAEAFGDEYKRLTGRWVRQVMEHLGAKFRRSHVPVIAIGSPFKSGSVYTFGSVLI